MNVHKVLSGLADIIALEPAWCLRVAAHNRARVSLAIRSP